MDFNSTSEGFEELSKEACGYGLSLGAVYYGAPIDATGRALNLYVGMRSFPSSIFSMTWRLGDVAASTVPLDASRLDMVWENVESFDQHAIIPSSAALRDSMLAHDRMCRRPRPWGPARIPSNSKSKICARATASCTRAIRRCP